MTGVLAKRSLDTDTQRGDHVTTEAEIGVMWPQAKGLLGHQKLEEAGRSCPYTSQS